MVPSLLPPFAPLRLLGLRAALLYPPLRLLTAGLSAWVEAAGGDPFTVSPFAAVVLTTVLGAIDLRRRGEVLLWANLGYPTVLTLAPFAVIATIGELFLALARP